MVRADRLLNGFMEEPQRPGGVFPSKPENLPLNAQSAAAFPPLSAPVGPHLPISPITPATTRLKSAQLAKPKESVAMGNLGTRNPGDITSVAPEPNRTVNVRNSKALSSHPQRANSMENCDFNHYSEEPKGEEPSRCSVPFRNFSVSACLSAYLLALKFIIGGGSSRKSW